MAFEPRGSIDGQEGRVKVLVQLADSQTVQVGDVIETYSTGKGTLGTADLPVLGVVMDICYANGQVIKKTGPVAGTAYTENVTSQATGTGGEYYAHVDISKNSLYSAAVSGTLGTTNSSNLRGCWVDVDSGNTEYGQVLETTATRTAHSATGGMGTFYSHGVDPNDSSRIIVSIANHEFDTQIDVTP